MFYDRMAIGPRCNEHWSPVCKTSRGSPLEYQYTNIAKLRCRSQWPIKRKHSNMALRGVCLKFTFNSYNALGARCHQMECRLWCYLVQVFCRSNFFIVIVISFHVNQFHIRRESTDVIVPNLTLLTRYY